jgi:hypothetical protein
MRMAIVPPKGGIILGGVKKTREAAKHAGQRALFFILLIRPEIYDHPKRPRDPNQLAKSIIDNCDRRNG